MGSNDSLYSNPSNVIFTPPIHQPTSQVFFNSDDSLFKTEKRKFVIPRIEIQTDEPVFNLQVTDFSDPSPKNVTLTYDESGQTMKLQKVEAYVKPKSKAQEFAQNKSFSIEVNRSCVDISSICDTDKFLSIGTKKLSRQKATSTSLIDLSSSTSSINSCIYESNLDLSQIDPDTSLKHWKSPFEIRHAKDLERDNRAVSEPALNKVKHFVSSRSKSVSEENLNNKLTEYERLEILKLLHDWSLNGSDSKSEFNLNLVRARSTENIESIARDEVGLSERYCSEPNLNENKANELLVSGKYNSDTKIASTILEEDFLHQCQYKNCIFNVEFNHNKQTSPLKLKGILKNSREALDDCNVTKNLSNESLKENTNINTRNNKTNLELRRYSEVIQTDKPLNSELIRCDSLERLTQMRKPKKFPESYIVNRKTQRLRSIENGQRPKSPKVIVIKKKCLPKTWKSCSDIKPKKPVKKCCKYAKKNCPILKNSTDSPKKARKAKSCACISEENILESIQDEQLPDSKCVKTSKVYFADENDNSFQDNFETDEQPTAMPPQRPGFAKQYSLTGLTQHTYKIPFKSLLRQNTMPETSIYCLNCQTVTHNDDPFVVKHRDGVCFGGQQQPASARLAAGFSSILGSAYLVHRKLTILYREHYFTSIIFLYFLSLCYLLNILVGAPPYLFIVAFVLV